MTEHLISAMLLLPLIGLAVSLILIQLSGRFQWPVANWSILTGSLLSALIGIFLAVELRAGGAIVETSEWIGSYSIRYALGIDGVNALTVLLLSVLFPLLVLNEWGRKERTFGRQALFMVLQTALLGAVCAQDFFLMSFFWSATLFPLYFLFAIWGQEGREESALSSLMVQTTGCALVFGSAILVFKSVEPNSFSFVEIGKMDWSRNSIELLSLEFSAKSIALILFGVGLSLRIPIWPLSGWFIRASEKLTPAAFIVYAGAVVPVGLVIFVRVFLNLFPEILSSIGNVLVWLGLANLAVGSIAMLAQTQLRSLFSYFITTQVGIFLLAFGVLTEMSVVGSVVWVAAIGVSAILAGFYLNMMTDRGDELVLLEGTRAAWIRQVPRMAGAVGVAMVLMVSVPGSIGFTGQALIMTGAYPVRTLEMVIFTFCQLLVAFSLTRAFGRVFLGHAQSSPARVINDLTIREWATLLPVLIIGFFLGVVPKHFIDGIVVAIKTLLERVVA